MITSMKRCANHVKSILLLSPIGM